MFPGHWGWGRSHGHGHEEGERERCGDHFRHARRAAAYAAGDDGGGLGVRRPLRFMAYKLDLNQEQVSALAKILDDLKTERAQAAVEERRVLAHFADALSGESFDAAKVKEAGALRVTSAERLRAAVEKALAQTHALLQPDQRQRLSYLLRTGVLTI
jgi:Spy/CpxP family protein refolding chaperone